MKRKKGGTLRYVSRAKKANENGKQPIELTYSIGGQRKYYGIGESVFPENWDSGQQAAVFVKDAIIKKKHPETDIRLIPTIDKIRDINRRVEQLKNMIEDIEERFRLSGVVYSSAMVVDELRKLDKPETKREERTNFVFEFIDNYVTENKATREPGSLTVYKSLKRHLQAFEKAKRVKVEFSTIDDRFFRQFQNFLSVPRIEILKGKEHEINLNNITIAKQLSTLKTFLNYARNQGVFVPTINFVIEKPDLEVIALSEKDFTTLYNFDLTGNQRLAQVRDVFCFSCATGLRYSDLKRLRWEHIKTDCIELVVKKTKRKKLVPLMIPLNPYSYEILNRYKDRAFPLPMSSNVKLNLYVKELCRMAGINEPVEKIRMYGNRESRIVYPKYELISMHVGRKTFCTLSLEKGMSAEEVMEISGHTDYKSFRRYVDVTNRRKRETMRNAWGGIVPESKLKAV